MWIETLGKVMSSPIVAGATGAPLDQQTARGPAEGHGRDLLDPRHRNQHQRNQQDQTQRQGKG